MFEHQIKYEYDRISEISEEISNINFVSLSEIFSDDNFYYNYFRAIANYQNFQNLALLSSTDYYPNNLLTNADAEAALSNYQILYSEISKEQVSQMLGTAVDLRFNYIIRPITTIVSFIFSENLTISAIEANHKISYFSGHNEIVNLSKEIIAEVLNRNKIDFIHKPAFEKSLKTALQKHLANLDAEGIVDFADDVYELFLELDARELINLSLMIFFDDLEIYGLVDLLEENNQQLASFDKSLLVGIIENNVSEIDIGFEHGELIEDSSEESRNIELEDFNFSENINESEAVNELVDEIEDITNHPADINNDFQIVDFLDNENVNHNLNHDIEIDNPTVKFDETEFDNDLIAFKNIISELPTRDIEDNDTNLDSYLGKFSDILEELKNID
ncbi:MAG: hypothetical protein KIT33_06785 [Candidatus Kapabacteria bacterium]|nr:hypothetical protein [Ignavibacteriota bacterium]MCW5884661.1 hypothetical protein [Candidatus Kapabacteria bacterium]